MDRSRAGVVLAVLGTAMAMSAPLAAQSGDHLLDEYLTRLARPLWEARRARVAALSTPDEVRARQRYIRERMTAEIGGFPAKTPLKARVTGTLVRAGYKVEKVIFESRPGLAVTANVYIPAGGHAPYPAVIGVAGHSLAGKADPTYQRAWIGMVRRGMLVLAFDPPGQGERIVYEGNTIEHTMMGIQCMLAGSHFARYEVWDGIRAFDYLLERGDVDPRRVAVAGNSGGGTQSAYLAVFEPRLAVAVPSCYITSWEKLWAGQGPQDAEQDFPGFLRDGFDFSDFLMAFAPKPIMMATAVRDFFPIAGARAAYAETRRVFSLLGAEDRAGYFEFDDEHGWSQPRREATYRWLEKHLLGRAPSGPEEPAAVEPERALWVTETGRVDGESVQSLNASEAEAIVRSAPVTADVVARTLGVAEREGLPVQLGDELLATEPAMAVVFRVSGAGEGKRPAVLAVGDSVEPGTDVVTASVIPRGWWPADRQAFPTLMRALLVGRTLAGMQVFDVLRAFDWLRAQSGVDANRITLRGRGNGAVIALYAAALDPRIARVEVQGGPRSYLEIVQARGHHGIENLVVPDVLHVFDLPDVERLVGSRLVRR